jgi:hypothetical protein
MSTAAILSAILLFASPAFAQDFVPTPVKRQVSGTPAPVQTTSPLPLTDYHYTYPNLPEQVNPFDVGRGPQSGYNICNSTTEGPDSLCQTMFINGIDDFCLWGSPTVNGLIGNVEAEVVAYCTKPGHGTRVMPAGTLTGVQFMRTSAYIQVTGQFNQVGIDLNPSDYGGELDPHGADLEGNPLGGLIFSSSLPTSNGTITQVQNWSNFVGSNVFCIKACDNSVVSPDYCENIFDLIGCTYNMPSNAYTSTEFLDCEGDLQMPPGQYISDGTTVTWKQPASLSPGTTLPWQPSIPASSSCTTYQSAQLYAAETGSLSTVATATTTSGAAPAGGPSGSGPTPAPTAAHTTTSGNAVPTHGAQVGMAAAAFAVVGAILA